MTRGPAPEAALDRFVAGNPASFATAAEAAWKLALHEQLAAETPDAVANFLELDFGVSSRIGYPLGPDLDNLCEPVFSVLVNRLKWCSGSRPAIRGFRATKRLASPTGCRIRASRDGWVTNAPQGRVLLDATYAQPLPHSARDSTLAGWVSTEMTGPPRSGACFAVALIFTSPLNLGDIATGRLKNVIDCLSPVIGGTQGSPADDRILQLEATKVDGPPVGLQITVMEVH